MKMKTFMMSVLLAGASVSQAATETKANVSAQQIAQEIARVVVLTQKLEAGLVAMNLINWQVGEYHNTTIKMAIPLPGKAHKYVATDVPARNAFWYNNDIEMLGQKQKTESLMSRANGEVLELIVNGEKQKLDSNPSEGLEIIEQYETEITVPAGKFDCMYIKANIKQDGKTQQLEAWINPIDVNLDGMLKVKIPSQMGTIEMLLKDFGKK